MTALVSIDTGVGECRRYVTLPISGRTQCTHTARFPNWQRALDRQADVDLQSIEDFRRFATGGKPVEAVA